MFARRTYTDPNLFMGRLKWKTSTEEFTDMNSLSIGCYCFRFEEPLAKDVQYRFLDLVEKLDLYMEQSIMLAGVWLCQQRVPFYIAFAWDGANGIRYNLRRLFRPFILTRHLRRNLDQAMAVDVGKCLAELKGANP